MMTVRLQGKWAGISGSVEAGELPLQTMCMGSEIAWALCSFARFESARFPHDLDKHALRRKIDLVEDLGNACPCNHFVQGGSWQRRLGTLGSRHS